VSAAEIEPLSLPSSIMIAVGDMMEALDVCGGSSGCLWEHHSGKTSAKVKH
jgi:hypothetical protein